MDLSRGVLRAIASATVMLLVACSSTSDRLISIDTFPAGASVRLGVDGQAAGQTPISKLHVIVPEGESLLLIVEKPDYQTIAYPVDASSPDRLFFCLQRLPDIEPIRQALRELQNNISAISAAVSALRAQLEKRGGN